MTSAADQSAHRFSLVVGGPFNALLSRLGLTGADRLPTQRAAWYLAAVAWLLPATLAVVQTLVDPAYVGWGYFGDWTAHTRYLVAIGVMIATERYADGRLGALVDQFRDAGIVPDRDRPAFQSALAAADRWSSSRLAEFGLLATALIWSSAIEQFVVTLSGVAWDGAVIDGHSVLSWAGHAARFVSTPLFLFLVLRWLWRFLVWSLLLYRISRLSLQLMPLHPDRSGGLGFLANFTGIFSGFVFAISCVVAAAMIKDLGLEQHPRETVWFAIAVWLCLSSGLVIGPLLVFIRPLYRLREKALIEYGRLASHHHLAFHRKWILSDGDGEDIMGSPDPSSAADLNATVELVHRLRYVPVDFPALLQLLVAAGLPMLAVIATLVPLGDLLKWLFGTLF